MPGGKGDKRSEQREDSGISQRESGELAVKRNGKHREYMERWQRGLTGNLL